MERAAVDRGGVVRALTWWRRGRDSRVRLVELADSEWCFDELLDCVSRTGGQWRCQRLVAGAGVGRFRLPRMHVETRVTARPLSPVCEVDDVFAAVPSNEPRASHYVVEALPVVRAFLVLHELAWAVGRC